VGESAFALRGNELNVRDNELTQSELAGVTGNCVDGLRKKNTKMAPECHSQPHAIMGLSG
jgi:hypothetical protein